MPIFAIKAQGGFEGDFLLVEIQGSLETNEVALENFDIARLEYNSHV